MNIKIAWIRRLAALCLCVLVMALPAAPARAEAKDITKQCRFKVSEGSRDKLTDGNVRSMWTYDRKDAYVAVKLPDDAQAGWLRVEWLYDPTGYELIEYDADMNPIRQRDQGDMFPNVYSVFELLPETKYIQLKMTVKGQQIGTVAVYSAGDLPAGVQQWQAPVEKADLMVVSTHQDDELIFLGGTIPYYATALKKPTVIVYMANCGRYRRAEALNALWKMGVKNYPEFINLKDEKVDSINAGIRLWGGKDEILSLIVERIRRFKPEVIVTQDLDGEYGHNQHKITARAMQYAIDAAADETQFPESLAKYGAWQVKKLYHHLYKENQIEMDWETPLDSLGGHTALEVAKLGMNEHASQLKYYRVKSHGTYDNAKFGLYSTTVGPDVEKNDFLENIDPDASEKYLAEHADEIAARRAAEAQEAADAVAAAIARDEAEEALAREAAEAEPEGDAPEDAGADEADAAGEEDAPVEAADEPLPGDGPGEEGEAPTASDGAVDAPQPTTPPQAAPLPTAAPAATREERGSSALPIVMIGAGVVAIGVGGWYGWRSMDRGRRRRRHRSRR